MRQMNFRHSGWPVPLEVRPAVQILRDRGKEWEQAKMQDLEAAFGNYLRGSKQANKFKEMKWLLKALEL